MGNKNTMPTNVSAPLTQDSDEVQEIYCEECEKYEDRYAPADGFCVDCVEYKCVDCLRNHRRNHKNHTIVDKNNMPQDFYFIKYSAHSKELITFYCSECEKGACQVCKNNDHKNGRNVSHMPTLVKDIHFFSEIKYQFKYDSSLCLLNENTLLATDYGSCSLIIFKITKTTSQCYDTIKTLSIPWDITKVADNKVAVTFPNERLLGEKMIELITFSDSMSVVDSHYISVSQPYYGIAYSNKTLIVSNEENENVQILDMSGHIIKTIGKDHNGKPLFTAPIHLAVSPDNKTIYVSDWDRHTVTSITFDGKIKAIYKDDKLAQPSQLTVDDSGTVYVCGSASHNVHQLSSDLTKVKILLNESHGMNRPVSVAYCKGNNRLYVGMWNSNIKVFNLK
ncbi:uncharacterized protein LOC128550733 [Mercenaria mercenaria]|uniref:uncharacterized protein LOC128550733 n=1 Tax=Mercenaria mercenaria TaxID=6596 RepID=UPI00234E7DC5|nr:uncharacterized protein LOC128550733 [Mercenaria mercenaria]